jgi:4-alpha-glucanotransferase
VASSFRTNTVLSPLRGSWGINVYITSAQLTQKCTWVIFLENGTILNGQQDLEHLPQTGDYWMNGTMHVRRVVPMPEDLPLGYHTITMQVGGQVQGQPLIVTPETSFQPEPMARGDKIWGTAIQLYTLRSENNWGMGDFTDLKGLVTQMSEHGADFVGLNPIHALYPVSPEHASPYSPSNRSFLNVLYVDITNVQEFKDSTSLQKKITTKTFAAKVEHLRKTEDVEYSGVSDLKHDFFKGLYKVYKKDHLGKDTPRARKFEDFCKIQGEPLNQHALFEALLSHFKAQDINAWGWPVWPGEYRDFSSTQVMEFAKNNVDGINYWKYLQFIADEQLQEVDALAKKLGMKIGLYRDLAVGADRGGAEIWGNKSSFCLDASVGAPPDALGPSGQNWGLPPLDPIKLKENGYSTFITLLRNNMRGCGALRIDHAMSMLRLWWCPPGKSAAYGAYVYYDMFDLLGILNLESQRNKCLVIAEDLGTVPKEVMVNFPKAQLYSNQVFYFEIKDEGCTEPLAYAPKALAIVCNHDMPTVKAYWNKSDLELRKKLSMFGSEKDYIGEKEKREKDKAFILEALEKHGLLPKGLTTDPDDLEEMTEDLCFAIHKHLASCNSQMIAMQLEDMMLINKPVNIPGTSDEYPNWRRKLLLSTGELFGTKEIKKLCKELSDLRN